MKTICCEDCGTLILVAPTGRKPKHCPECLKKQRKQYHHARYVTVSIPKLSAKLRKKQLLLSTLKGTKISREILAKYEQSAYFKDLQNLDSHKGEENSDFVGGSGYNEPLFIPKHLRLNQKKYESTSVKLTPEMKKFLEKQRKHKEFLLKYHYY